MPQQQLDPHMWEIDKLCDNKIYNVPVYQRPYSWDTDNVEVLLNDLHDAYTSSEKTEGYYVGNLLLHDKNIKINGSVTVFEVIDGQQRITTISLLLLALYSIATSRNGSDDDTYRDLKKYLWKKVYTRSPEKEYKLINLNSTEKNCFNDLFNNAYEHPDQIKKYAKNYKSKSVSEKYVIDNFLKIYEMLELQFAGEIPDSILDYSKYILENVRFIAIECRCNVSKVFTMFESINSKGKKLEDIDLIKTYIFSKLDENSYDEYLAKWGQLIINTDNNLYDYFYTYIKAYITFYRQNIKIVNFKAMSENSLMAYYKKDNICDTFKAFIDDMTEKVKYYNMLSDYSEAVKLINSKRFRFYYKVFSGYYIHPKPLFMRIFSELAEGKISKDTAVDVFEEIIKYMIKFTNIASLESKDVITLFSNIMQSIYESNGIDKDLIMAQITNETLLKGIDDNKISLGLEDMDAFVKNRKVSIALLALYESISTNEYNETKISYDKAYMIIDSFSEALSLDHLLPQTPDENDDDYKYYCKKNNDSLLLELKEGSDFPDNIKTSMNYDVFKSTILNKLGNLRLDYQDKNSGRQNTAIELHSYGKFTDYSDITKREKEVVSSLVKHVLKMPDANTGLIKKGKTKSVVYPKMEELIDQECINIGDEVYLVNVPDNSKATLVEANKVNYQGTIMSLNTWGCKLTGWSSIRIYSYVSIVGETETLQQKRDKLINK